MAITGIEQNTQITQTQTKAGEHSTGELTLEQSNKMEFQRTILQASMNTTISAGDNSMALLLKSAIENINEALEPYMGENAIEKGVESGIDVSPEATADRIVSLTTAFFPAYQEQHPEMSQEDALNSFIDIIGGGIEQGFNEARDILGSLNVLEGSIAENIDKTFELVQQGLQKFIEQGLGIKAEPQTESMQTISSTASTELEVNG